VYRTTNLINQKFYIGYHKTLDPYDDYLGSGKYLKQSIAKYGHKNFKKEVLFIFNTSAEAFAKEKELVAEHLGQKLCMNIAPGGGGGFEYININGLSYQEWGDEKRKIYAIRMKKQCTQHLKRLKLDEHYQMMYNKSYRLGMERMVSEGKMTTFAGRRHTEETKAKIGKVTSEAQKGTGNSQFGSFWITDGTVNKKCRGEIPEGFWKGRKC